VRTDRHRFLAGAILLILPLIFAVIARSDSEETTLRWDIISVDFNTLTASAGGNASARANDGSKITLKGSGTFKPDDPEDVTGGGTWTTFASNGTTVTGSGTYEVKSLVKFDLAPGTFPLATDNIGNPLDFRSGLVVLRIRYSPGGQSGILVVSCAAGGTSPPTVFEGITASKGFVDYWNREMPPAPPGDANRTAFHVVPQAGN
jgi:hypothetical protein